MDNKDSNIRQWDAEKYHSISHIQEKWGRDLINRRKWHRNEIVMDAGCGTGRVTKLLAEIVSKGGMVYAVDIDPNMIQQSLKNLANIKNVIVIQSDLVNVELPRKVDVIFSNAVLHWVSDHKKVFQNFWKLICDNNDDNNSKGGQLLIQYGGQGNLEKVHRLLNQVKELDEFRDYFINWNEPWYFGKPDETRKLLQEIGFKNVNVYLSEASTTFSVRKSYSEFVKAVVMKPFLEYLPHEKQRSRYLELFLDKVEQSGLAWILDYMRLNIIAEK
jgi:trans-aconitate methyltransferase